MGSVVDTEQRPVLSGLIALAAVAVVVGLLGGLVMLVGVKALGLDGEEVAIGGSGGPSNTLYLPSPPDTETSEPSAPETEPEPEESAPATPEQPITLSASQTSVAPMQQVDLTGTYPTGEGAILQVQRLDNGNWTDFPVTVSVTGNTFATYVQTSRPGENKFRVIDNDTQTPSNEIVVTVG